MCLDETSKQLVSETRANRTPRPGAPTAYDYEYRRNGVSSLFMLFAPLEGWRRVEVRERRTMRDWAQVVRRLVDEDYPDRERIVLVMDNLNTHHPSSLHETFEPEEAQRVARRLELHYTPKHRSWLNMAEIELGVLARQCLDRRILQHEIAQTGNRSLPGTTKPRGNQGGLALRPPRIRQDQAPIPISINSIATAYKPSRPCPQDIVPRSTAQTGSPPKPTSNCFNLVVPSIRECRQIVLSFPQKNVTPYPDTGPESKPHPHCVPNCRQKRPGKTIRILYILQPRKS